MKNENECKWNGVGVNFIAERANTIEENAFFARNNLPEDREWLLFLPP